MVLKFECPHCEARLSAGPDLFRSQTHCPECHNLFVVPNPEDLSGPDEMIKFLCPFCNRKLSAVPVQYGREMPCPFTDCQKPLMVPHPEWKPVPTSRLK